MKNHIERQIKKKIYGKYQTVDLFFPPGFGDIALAETQSIIKTPWFSPNRDSELSLLKNKIRIKPIHMFSITELLIRNQCLWDVRLVIFEGKVIGKKAFEKKCRDVYWPFYINKTMSIKIKVDSIASKAFHETGLKDILRDIVKEHVHDIVSGENSGETTSLYVHFFQDKLTLSISLAGNPLYKRKYRGTLSASAPLREDAAACCIQKSLQFASRLNTNFTPDTVYIPFSGTGTFAFEYLQYYFHFSPALFEREYALQKMPLFNKKHFDFLLKKAKEYCLLPTMPTDHSHSIHFQCLDNSLNANAALLENITLFKQSIVKHHFFFPTNLFTCRTVNFFEMDIANPENKIEGNIFMPLNPPYGLRMEKQGDLYKNIARKINTLSKRIHQEKKQLLGFILCPDKDTWATFCKHIACIASETYHFTQGGMDIRVCQFFI